MLAVVGAIRADTAHERAEAALARATAAAKKTPQQKYPHSVIYMRRLAGVAEDGSEDAMLPELAQELANATSSEKRMCLQARLTKRASEPGAATTIPPIATKELLHMYEEGLSVAPTVFRLDDLNAGISAFTAGWRQGTEKGEIVQQRQMDYDAQQRGGTQVTLAEQQRLSTKELPAPATSWEATQMLNGLSIVVDEFQGAGHDHARALRVFLHQDWAQIVHAIEAMSVADREAIPHLWTRLLREIQLEMGAYLRAVLTGVPHPLPTYSDVRRLVFRRQWNNLASVPSRYLLPASAPGPYPSSEQAAAAANRDTTKARARAVENPAPNAGWQQRYQSSGKTLAQLRAHAPQDTDNTDMCLSWHLRGSCYSNCSRRSTHRALTGAPLRKMNTFVNTHCVTTTAPAPAAEPGAGGGGGSGPAAGRASS